MKRYHRVTGIINSKSSFYDSTSCRKIVWNEAVNQWTGFPLWGEEYKKMVKALLKIGRGGLVT